MIWEVVYIPENPEAKAFLLRKSIRSLREVEFLQIIDLALKLVGDSLISTYGSKFALVHNLTGIELLGFH